MIVLVHILHYENAKALPMDHLKPFLFHQWYRFHSLGTPDWVIRVSLSLRSSDSGWVIGFSAFATLGWTMAIHPSNEDC